MELTTPISQFSRVGSTTARHLERLGLRTACDLLYYFPFRYEDFRQIVPIKDLQEGATVTVAGQLELIANRRSFRAKRMVTEALVTDATGSVRVVWFNQPFLTKTLHPGDNIFLSGTVKSDMLGLQFVSPVYEKKGSGDTMHTARLVPIYPLTGGVTEKQLRFLMKQALPLAGVVPEWLPEETRRKYQLTTLSAALTAIHFPVDVKDVDAATRRLKFDELLLLQLRAEIARRDRLDSSAPKLIFQEKAIQEFVRGLPFILTKTQKVAAWEILKDIAEGKPMNRLLSGDVGSGKTVVAALALYNCALNGHQGVLMAPTEILAAQHFASLQGLLSGLPLALHTRTQHFLAVDGRVEKHSKTTMTKLIEAGQAAVIVGTHSLITEDARFRKLGLVIVDEQHRFGVLQRKIIKGKGEGAHFLSMTATPIPRSLALMLYGDLEVSIINELPPGRKKIITRLVEPMKRDKAYGFIRDQVKSGRQVFVVCPLIEQGAVAQAEKKSVMAEYEKLSKTIFPDLKVAFLHGKLKSAEKEAVMADFKNGITNILVATSVIEVGVNIPNASVMMIEGAEQFGLAQLHQFRGRVGRSDHQSYCLLFTDTFSKVAEDRLKYFETHNDGFSLAEKDLEIRGPGELYGTEQSGAMQLRLAKLTDVELVRTAREAARDLIPQLAQYPLLQKMLREAEQMVHLE